MIHGAAGPAETTRGYEVTDLKRKIRAACSAVDTPAYRQDAAAHLVCPR